MYDCFVGIDWGISHRRAYVFDAQGQCLGRKEDNQGMLAVAGQFQRSLSALLATLVVEDSVPVIMSGMVGSAQGWREVPYLEPGIPLTELPSHLFHLDRQRYIVPGYARCGVAADVMRGEETQLFGLLTSGIENGWVALAGTHSKWVYLEKGRLQYWSTHMTGELFATLVRLGTLAPLLNEGDDDDAAFATGLDLARLSLPLSNSLFSVRAGVVSGVMPARHARSMVSGLLIGGEFAAMVDSGIPCEELYLVASPALRGRYERAATAFGLRVHVTDSHAIYGAAMARLFREGVRNAT